MKKTKQLVPKRRFKEFENDGEWIQYNLEDLVHVNSGRDYKHLSPGTIPVYGTGGYMVSVDEALSYSTDAIGIGRKGTIDRPYLLEAPFWTVDTLFYATIKENNNLYFMLDAFKNISWRAQQETSGVPSLTRTAINNVEIFVPKNKEQEKIGLFTKKLERIIRQQQLKIRKLKDLKESYLSDMFPKEGEEYPEKRFEGFTDSWEQYSLGELTPLRGGYSFQSSSFIDDGIPIVRISNILTNETVGGSFAFYPEQTDDERYLLPHNAAVLAMSGATTGKVSILDNPSERKVYQNQRVGYFRDMGIVDYSLMSTLVKSFLFDQQLKDVLVTGAQPNVSPKEIDSFTFRIPKDKEEQNKIATFFKNLDKQIDVEERKLNKLEQLKQAYLNELFV